MRSRFGDRLLRGAVLCTLLVSSNALAQSTVTDRPERSAFAIRLSAQALADMLAANFGAEVGGNVAVTHRLEVGAAASLGRYVGARAFVTLHPRDDGELLRPYVTARLLVHPVPDRVAVGGGAGLGLLIPLGRGRVTAGVLLEVYAGPAHFIPATAFASLGYEFDLYAPRPLLASAGPTVPVEVPAVTPPEPTPVPAPAPAPPVAVVVTPPPPVKPIIPDAGPVKVTFRDVIAFAPGKATLDAKAKATVARIASALRAEPRVRLLQVSGHADDGPEGGHQELGLRRAQAVLGALVESGVQSGRLTARSYGDALTLAPPSASVQARAKNRRVDFLILE